VASVNYCGRFLPVRTKTKYDPADLHRCFRVSEHTGACAEFPYLEHLKKIAPRVAAKIVRDATKTTGASWKSEEAGPNRISRWTMMLSDGDLMKLGIDMKALKPGIVAKLRDKAASYDDCMNAARRLTWSVYGMLGAPLPDAGTQEYLTSRYGPVVQGSTVCLICRAPLNFALFESARRGRAEIETAHALPRSHTESNVGFAHRNCNIAQGDKSLPEFYEWIASILDRVGRR
jgi:hypothetical protein